MNEGESKRSNGMSRSSRTASLWQNQSVCAAEFFFGAPPTELDHYQSQAHLLVTFDTSLADCLPPILELNSRVSGRETSSLCRTTMPLFLKKKKKMK